MCRGEKTLNPFYFVTFTSSPSPVLFQFQFLHLAISSDVFDRVGSGAGEILFQNPAAAAGELVAGRCDNDTTHQLRQDSGATTQAAFNN